MADYEHRDLAERDLEAISMFPTSRDELFFIGPRFVYPLTPEQIREMLANRASPTVLVNGDDAPIAYANLYDLNPEGSTCWLGNVIISPAYRGQGVAEHLLRTMMHKARDEHGIGTLKLYCHNTNTRALLFYVKHGFVPCGGNVVENREGIKIVAIEMERRLTT
ncbi:GNAT family N-acetyltransferase [Cohnella sp. GCM10027633]|uniref:GNAT family N-acetyltransferase n=1 Tax=unclassified Cohnella TaxID=2636738 RepID=UPI0036313CE4